jgi:hypothetical protein
LSVKPSMSGHLQNVRKFWRVGKKSDKMIDG